MNADWQQPSLRQRGRVSPVTTACWTLLIALTGAGSGLRAVAQSIAINDLGSGPITAVVADSLNPGDNGNKTADQATPQKLDFSFSVDGRGGGSGVALLLNPGGKTVSDLLEVNVTQRFRGAGSSIPYLSIAGTFTSDDTPQGLDISTLGLTDAIKAKVLQMALIEDGTFQDIGARLIDTTTGDALEIDALKITAASDVPEPSSILLCSGLIAAWALVRRLRAA